MTPEEIIKNNVLIAKFVGFTPTYPNMKDCNVFRFQKNFPKFDQALYTSAMSRVCSEGRFESKDITQRVRDDEFEFHYNLGWLIPVVEVIETLQDNSFRVLIDYTNCVIYHAEDRAREYCNFTAETKVKATWLAVVEFIKLWKEINEILIKPLSGDEFRLNTYGHLPPL